METDPPSPGISFLDHTADVGLELHAPTLEQLFERAARGMVWLLQGLDRAPRENGSDPTHRPLELSGDDPPSLLRSWLRELLHWHEAEGLAFHGVRFEVLIETRLEAVVSLVKEAADPVREIKGVTLHGLLAERREGAWTARVIFDV